MNEFKRYVTGLWRQFWNDESGAILSAEAALLGTVGVVGAGAGLSAISDSVDAELKEVGFAIRSLDQSYSIPAVGCQCECGKAWTAGSSFTQQCVEVSHRELQQRIDELEQSAAQNADVKQRPVETQKMKPQESQRVSPKRPDPKKEAAKKPHPDKTQPNKSQPSKPKAKKSDPKKSEASRNKKTSVRNEDAI